MLSVLKTVGGALAGPLLKGLVGRVTRHSITPGAIILAGTEGFTDGVMHTLEADAYTYGSAAGAFVVSLVLSRVSDAVQEVRERR